MPDLTTLELTSEDFELYANIDWITVTTREDSIGHEWQEIYQHQRQKAEVQMLLTSEKRWKIMSYEGNGYPGSIRVGFSEKLGWIVIASSSSADIWKKLVGSKARVTRIDLAVTQSLLIEIEEVPRRYYEALSENDIAIRNYSLIQNKKKGQTLYVGSRRSEKFGRLYDKGAESGQALPGFRYRWEVEYKKPSSDELARALSAVKEREAETITAMVFEFFDQRGVPPLFPKSGHVVSLSTQARVTSLDRKLNWIRSQVRPSIGEIIMAGRTRELFEAFGIEISDHYLVELETRAKNQGKVPTYDFLESLRENLGV